MKKLLHYSSTIAIVMGVLSLAVGSWVMLFTYQSIARENIVTPADASIPEQPVRGPFTLMSQANVIRKHTLLATGDKTYAEMPKEIARLDEKGEAVLDAEGQPVMVANTERDIWITAMTLTTALNLAILMYAISGLVIVFGLTLILVGILANVSSRRVNLAS